MAPSTTGAPRKAPEAATAAAAAAWAPPIEGPSSLPLSRSKSDRHQHQPRHRRTFSSYIKRQDSKEKGGGAVDAAGAAGAGAASGATGAGAGAAAGAAGAKKKTGSPKEHPHFVWILWGSFLLTINAGFINTITLHTLHAMPSAHVTGPSAPIQSDSFG